MKKRDKLKRDFECLESLGVVSDLAYRTNIKEVEERLNKSIENSKSIVGSVKLTHNPSSPLNKALLTIFSGEVKTAVLGSGGCLLKCQF